MRSLILNCSVMDNSSRTAAENVRMHNEYALTRHALLKHFQVVSAMILVLLTAFHSTSVTHPVYPWVYASALVSLALGILLSAIPIRGLLSALKSSHLKYLQEAKSAIQNDREPVPVFADERTINVFCEKAAYMLWICALCALTVCGVWGAFA
ncbi:MAG: hypothetical protein PHW19_07575 [Salinivirgaceae bacterium]|nr:hypothetical protein [Salinivirgaceae bacterium]